MSDQINSTRIVTDDTGTVVYSAAHDPYGGIQRTWVNTFDPALKFSGKERDGESDLDYFGARYYDKSQYRFISTDPLTIQSGFLIEPHSNNLYTYCGNSPLINIDRAGKWKSKVHYNVTYKAMLMAFKGWDPGFAARLADTVAGACAGVDSSPSTTSTPWWSFIFIGQTIIPWLELPDKRQRQTWHFPTSADLDNAFDVANSTLDPIEFGKALHVIQDSFAHGKYVETASHVWEWFENIFGGRDPDNPLDFWSPALAMAELTLDLCYGYEQRLKEAI
ncbi:MAG: RHS repeat-associated core domain-containing protein [Acidobacteriota bacterium]